VITITGIRDHHHLEHLITIPGMRTPGDIKSEWWARSSRNPGRDQIGTPGRDRRNQHVILRPGVQSLLQDAQRGKFDIVLAEALDRDSRDQADVATLFKHLRFAGVQIVTLAEGEISELHVGLKGTMNALFLKDLAAKTHRGLRGRVEKGKAGGGLCYGYGSGRTQDQ
jgi:DNA invertase Pin-like site-specific DNA recombinase